MPDRRHILIIPSERYLPEDSPLSGIFQQDQAHALTRAGYRVGVISPPTQRFMRTRTRLLRGWPDGVLGRRMDGEIPMLTFEGWFTPRVRSKKEQWPFAVAALFRKYCRRYGRPDVVHAHNAILAGVTACVIGEKFGVPYVVTEHSTAYGLGTVSDEERGLAQRAFRGAGARIVVSPALGAVLEKVLGESVRPWLAIPNMIPRAFETLDVRRTDPAAERGFRFLNVGLLEAHKGQADLLAAFARSFRGDADVTLAIAGPGPLRGDLDGLAAQLGIAEQVSFLGPLTREQVLAEMQDCSAYVHSSRYETFGVVLIEALACGKPVVSTAYGGSDYILNSNNGLLVPVADVDALAAAMSTMRQTAGGYDGRAIREDCLARFGERAVVSRLAEVYEQVISLKG